MGILAKLNQWNKAEARKKILNEPLFQKMEKVMLAMKEFYATNGWIFTDTEAMAVLNSMRNDYEKAAEKIHEIADEQKKHAHNELEERMNRQVDKQSLELQFKSMQREYHTINKLAELKKGKHAIAN